VLSYRHITQRLKLDSFTPSTGCVNINKTTHKKARYGVKRVGQASRSYWVSTLNSKKHGANQFQKMPYTRKHLSFHVAECIACIFYQRSKNSFFPVHYTHTSGNCRSNELYQRRLLLCNKCLLKNNLVTKPVRDYFYLNWHVYFTTSWARNDDYRTHNTETVTFTIKSSNRINLTNVQIVNYVK
jgi:hypothetical protein